MIEFEEFKKTIGEEVKKRRQALGLTQRELAERIGISQTMGTAMETTNPPIVLNNIWRLCEALGCDPIEFMNSIIGKHLLTSAPEERLEEKMEKAITKALSKKGTSRDVTVIILKVEGR